MATKAAWGVDDIGDLTGTVALVTGANSGIGYKTAGALAGHGAHVVLACRDPEKGRRAFDKLESDLDRSSMEVLPLDLADLSSVRQAAQRFSREHARLDLLVNNAGVMGTPYRLTGDGLELQMATNHFGHFALTGLLLDRLLTSSRSRIVTVTSQMHRIGRVRPNDVGGIKRRNTWVSYGTSKLSNLLFTAELDRRLRAEGVSTIAVAAHPGWTRSNLAGSGASVGGRRVRGKVARTAGHTFGQSTEAGALPTLLAATGRGVQGGQVYGPAHVVQLFGPPTLVRPSRRATNTERAAALWSASEEMTGVRYSHIAASR
ncbi:MAG TPA: oxidoreductase [Acidimicrobiales bacterium]